MVLDKINGPNDVKKLDPEEVIQLSYEIREFLINKLSKTGGHIASNLGVIELTIALHLVCDLPKDKIIWDVGHQSYTHKILTGRKDGFDNLRQFGGMSGFPKRSESDCDVFDTGHSTTSISAALGMAWAREMKGEDYKITCVSMGNPHGIVCVEDVDGLEIEKIGPHFENHPAFPDRVNTEFIRVIDRKTVQMRVWERGSGETWACGTGACAAAVACILNGWTEDEVTVKLRGGDLRIQWDRQKNTVFMTGPATVVFDGEINI